jgi:hypothetical protein
MKRLFYQEDFFLCDITYHSFLNKNIVLDVGMSTVVQWGHQKIFFVCVFFNHPLPDDTEANMILLVGQNSI